MFNKTLLPDTLRAIQLISHLPIIQGAYLAGGTALALQIGHRISVDLDFFTPDEFDENSLSIELQQFPAFKLENKAWRTIMGKIGETKFSIFYYKNPLIDKTVNYEGINLASKKDIAAMKINALESRGSQRDFIDIYFLSKHYKLEEMFNFYNLKYGILDAKLYSILRGLDYFEDAENLSEIPTMIQPISWEKVKKFFHSEAMRLRKSLL
jgi:predicted nucleotidyltransferase component of viral defense system